MTNLRNQVLQELTSLTMGVFAYFQLPPHEYFLHFISGCLGLYIAFRLLESWTRLGIFHRAVLALALFLNGAGIVVRVVFIMLGQLA